MPKGRPKLTKEASDSRKREIISIAKRLFVENGYQSVSMRKIASVAGLSPMMLYKSFENKRDLLRFIWTDIFVEVSNQCNRALETQNSDSEKLYAFCDAFLQYWLRHPEHYRVVYLESDQLEGKGDSYFADEAVIQELFTQLGELVQNLSSEGVDVDLKVKLLVLQLQGIAHGLIVISEIPWGSHQSLLSSCLEAFERSLISSDFLPS